MKLAIMQPYFFPYIGYFQLINKVDTFIFYDDVNYIKSGWINRNRIYADNNIKYITVPLNSPSSFSLINETKISTNVDWRADFVSTLKRSYSKAPFYNNAINIFQRVIYSKTDESIAKLAQTSVEEVCHYLGISRQFKASSNNYKNKDLKSQERIIDICAIESTQEYWNLPGGKSLYSSENFSKKNINLKFLDVTLNKYTQNSKDFIPGLSILDVMMFNSPENIVKNIIGS